MFQNSNSNGINFSPHDVKKFKIFALIYVLSRISILFANFFLGGHFSIYINYMGTFFLAMGIFFIAYKYNELRMGYLISILFIVTIVLDFLSDFIIGIDAFASVTDSNFQTTILSTEFNSQIQALIMYVMLLAFITLINSYLFTSWFNNGIAQKDNTNIFLYYGIFFFIGSALLSFSIYSVLSFAKNAVLNHSSIDTEAYVLSTLFLLAGSVLTLIASVLNIVAGFKIYIRSEKATKGDFSNYYFSNDYKKPYSSNSFVTAIRTAPPPKRNFTTIKSFYSENTCKNCGLELSPNTIFCQGCGSKIS